MATTLRWQAAWPLRDGNLVVLAAGSLAPPPAAAQAMRSRRRCRACQIVRSPRAAQTCRQGRRRRRRRTPGPGRCRSFRFRSRMRPRRRILATNRCGGPDEARNGAVAEACGWRRTRVIERVCMYRFQQVSRARVGHGAAWHGTKQHGPRHTTQQQTIGARRGSRHARQAIVRACQSIRSHKEGGVRILFEETCLGEPAQEQSMIRLS